jgi:predicted amidophosphoribosyltransferase
VGLLVYLIARPEHARLLSCPGCGREVNGGAFCPHCGRDLSSAICSACRYPLKPDWAFCPACRTEIRPLAAGTPVTQAG